MIFCDHSRRAACAAALLLTALVSSAHAQSGRTLSWQFGTQGASMTDGDPGDLNPQPLWISMPFSIAVAGGTITGIVNGGYIAGIGAEMVQLTSCTITGGSAGFADTFTMTYTFPDAPMPIPYAGASLNGRYIKAGAPGNAGVIGYANIDLQCHLNGLPQVHAAASGRPYSGPGPVPFWDLDIRTNTGVQVATSVMGVVPFALGALNDAIFLPNSAEAFAGPYNNPNLSSPMRTMFAANSTGASGGTAMFDLTVYHEVAITQIDLNSASPAGTNGWLEVSIAPMGRVGMERTPHAWTLTNLERVTTAATNTPTVCPLTSPVVLVPGIYGVMLHPVSFALASTIGDGSNQMYLNGDMLLSAGCTQSSPYGPITTPRVANTELHYTTTPGRAAWSVFGTGCNQGSRSFYEDFAGASSFDLANSAMTLTLVNDTYQASRGGTYSPPSAAATVLSLTDDSEVTVPLNGMLQYPGGATFSLCVCSNGFVSAATGNGTAYTPTAGDWLASVQPRWGTWHDFNPSAGGHVAFERIGSVAYVTWVGVADYGVPGSASTWQLQFDTSSGRVVYAWQNMSLTGNGHLVGFAALRWSDDPGSRDLSATLPAGFATAGADGPLQLATAGQRPVLGSSVSLVTTNQPAGANLVGSVLGLSSYSPGIDLSFLGMPGCLQFVAPASVQLIFGGYPRSFFIPNDPSLSGIDVFSQSVAFAAGVNPLGLVSSNAVRLTVGTF